MNFWSFIRELTGHLIRYRLTLPPPPPHKSGAAKSLVIAMHSLPGANILPAELINNSLRSNGDKQSFNISRRLFSITGGVFSRSSIPACVQNALLFFPQP